MVWWMGLALAGVSGELVAERVADVADARTARLNPRAPDVPADAYLKAATGQVVTGLVDVPGHKARKAWGVTVVDVPIASYFSAVNDDRSKVEFTQLSHLEVIEGAPCDARRVVFQYLPVSLLTDRWWVVEQKINQPLHDQTEGRVREVTWTQLPDGATRLGTEAQSVADGGMEVTHTEGGWLLIDLDGTHTLVEYWSWSDPGGSVPARLASSFAAGGIENTVQAMRDLARRGPTCRL